MGTLTFLVGDKVTEIKATLCWSEKDPVARAFDVEGGLVAELEDAKVVWMESSGIRLSGLQLVSPREKTYCRLIVTGKQIGRAHV